MRLLHWLLLTLLVYAMADVEHSFHFSLHFEEDSVRTRDGEVLFKFPEAGGGRDVTFELRWSSGVPPAYAAGKFCYDIAVLSWWTCHSLESKLEAVAELGSYSRYLSVFQPEDSASTPAPSNIVYIVPSLSTASLPPIPGGSGLPGPRTLQLELWSMTPSKFLSGYAVSPICSVLSTLPPATLEWLQAQPEHPRDAFLIHVSWNHPEHNVAEVVAQLASCFKLPRGAMKTLHGHMAGMSKYGPSLEEYKREVSSEYVFAPVADVHFDFRITADLAVFDGDVRFFPNTPSITSSPSSPLPIPPPPLPTHPPPATAPRLVSFSSPHGSIAVVLTVYKRRHLLEQLIAISRQSVTPNVVYICQNENHVDVRPLLAALRDGDRSHESLSSSPVLHDLTLPFPFEVHHIHSPTLNQKYHGRFAFLNMISEDFVGLFDDDKIPGSRWLEHAISISAERGGIVGYSGRLWSGSSSYHVPVYRANKTLQVDYVGQCWVFRSEWVRFMWQDRPVSIENAEDMQFSAAALERGGVRTYIPSQPSDQPDVWCDLKPEYGIDKVSSSITATAAMDATEKLAWGRERSGILNYHIAARGFLPLVQRAPQIFLDSLEEIPDIDSGAVSKERQQALLEEKTEEDATIQRTIPTSIPSTGEGGNDACAAANTYHILLVFGTRPEAIKLAPVILEVQNRVLNAPGTTRNAVGGENRGSGHKKYSLQLTVVSTGQHREMLLPVLRDFDIHVDVSLNVSVASPALHDRTESDVKNIAVLPGLAGRILMGLDGVLEKLRPDIVVVQGDTSSALLGALAAFYHKIPIAHVEAGLRTGRRYDPFPEEMHRRLITALSTLHFAPTQNNAWNVLGELAPAAAAAAAMVGEEVGDLNNEFGGSAVPLTDERRGVHVVGSTAIDALHIILSKSKASPPVVGDVTGTSHTALAATAIAEGRKGTGYTILVTAHRRENLGPPLGRICDALLEILRLFPDATIIFPVHLSPSVQTIVREKLGGHARVKLLPPLDHSALVQTLSSCRLVLTDSGGLQEEAPALGIPLLVLRDRTERVEGVHAGSAKLVGTSIAVIVKETSRLLRSFGEIGGAYDKMARIRNPYGDGMAAVKIVDEIVQYLIRRVVPQE